MRFTRPGGRSRPISAGRVGEEFALALPATAQSALMKCIAMRLGEEFHDLDDVRYLLRYLNLSTPEEAVAIVLRYFDENHLLPKTRLVLEELLPEQSSPGAE